MASFIDFISPPRCYDEPVSKKVERLEKELSDLKARAAADAEAKKPKTVGEAIAENAIRNTSQYYGGATRLLMAGVNCGYILQPDDKPNLSASVPKIIDETRRYLASLIDKAVEEAKAEQREKDAKYLAARVVDWSDYAGGYEGCVVRQFLNNYALSIRTRK